jgi:hypothetical protein
LGRIREDLENETGKAIDGEDGRRFVGELVEQTGLRRVPGAAPMMRALLHILSGNETRAVGAISEWVSESVPAAVKRVKKRRRRKRQDDVMP